jgi:hypothetical protein
MMRGTVTILATIVCLSTSLYAQSTAVSVPGTANLWLAGMADGTTMSYSNGQPSDSAPAQSPVLVSGMQSGAGQWVEFSGVTGLVSIDPTWHSMGPEGLDGYVRSRVYGTNYWKSNITAPVDGLIGVFLSDMVQIGIVPPALDFSTAASRDYSTLSPMLNQTFFIGDGLVTDGTQQKVFVPAGATRLFLGTLDTSQWGNNTGAFDLTVTVVPEPATMTMLTLAGAALLRFRRRR